MDSKPCSACRITAGGVDETQGRHTGRSGMASAIAVCDSGWYCTVRTDSTVLYSSILSCSAMTLIIFHVLVNSTTSSRRRLVGGPDEVSLVEHVQQRYQTEYLPFLLAAGDRWCVKQGYLISWPSSSGSQSEPSSCSWRLSCPLITGLRNSSQLTSTE